MICTSVIPCSSNGLAKRNNKIMSMSVLFSRLLWSFRKVWLLSKILHQSSRTRYFESFSQKYSKVTIFFKTVRLF